MCSPYIHGLVVLESRSQSWGLQAWWEAISTLLQKIKVDPLTCAYLNSGRWCSSLSGCLLQLFQGTLRLAERSKLSWVHRGLHPVGHAQSISQGKHPRDISARLTVEEHWFYPESLTDGWTSPPVLKDESSPPAEKTLFSHLYLRSCPVSQNQKSFIAGYTIVYFTVLGICQGVRCKSKKAKRNSEK